MTGRYHWLMLLAMVAAITPVAAKVAGGPPAADGLSPAETYVLQMLVRGEIADLKVRFPHWGERRLSAGFLAAILGDRPADNRSTTLRVRSLMATAVHGSVVHIEHALLDEDLDLSNTRIRHQVVLRGCRFKGKVDLSSCDLERWISFDDSRFESPKGAVNFESIKAASHVDLIRCFFAGPVDFSFAAIGGALALKQARFRYPGGKEAENCATLWGAKMRFLVMDGAEFSGPVTLIRASIEDDFQAVGARFLSSDETVFNSIKVGGGVFLNDSSLSGSLDLAGLSAGGNLELSNAQFTNRGATVDFRGATARRVLLDGTAFSGKISIHDLSYQYISAGEGPGDWRKLLRLANRSEYDGATYQGLADYFRRAGYPSRSQAVLYERECRVTAEDSPWYVLPGRWMLWGFAAYGYNPLLALLWSAVFVLYGWWLYRDPKRMELRKPDETNRRYNSFWYSFSLFVPVVDIDSASVWRPQERGDWRSRWRVLYMRIHVLLGWIIVPIGVGALTGLIR